MQVLGHAVAALESQYGSDDLEAHRRPLLLAFCRVSRVWAVSCPSLASASFDRSRADRSRPPPYPSAPFSPRQAEAQAHLFGRVCLSAHPEQETLDDSASKFFGVLSTNPHRRQQLRYLDLSIDPNLSTPLLRLLQKFKLPSLRHLIGLRWQSAGNTAEPLLSPPITILPRLGFLTIVLEPLLPRDTSFSSWFDLTHLKELVVMLVGTSDAIQLVPLLQSVSANLQTLFIDNIPPEEYSSLISTLGRFRRLELLNLTSDGPLGPAASHDLLVVLPSLRRISLHTSQVESALAAPHPNLEILTIINLDNPDGADDNFLDVDISRSVDTLCNIVREHPRRFPSLRFVHLESWHACSFKSKDLRRIWWNSGIMLDKVGLVLRDSAWVGWRQEWNDE